MSVMDSLCVFDGITVGSSACTMPSKPLSGKRLVLLSASVMALLALAIFLAFTFIGRRQLVRASLLSEGRRRLGDFGEGMARCGANAQGLPPSSPLVPADFGKLAGPGYQSTANDWDAEAFRCAHFAPTDATAHFQLGWVRLSDESGEVRAVGDIDRDGIPDTAMSAPVKCRMHASREPNAPKIADCGIGPVEEGPLAAASWAR